MYVNCGRIWLSQNCFDEVVFDSDACGGWCWFLMRINGGFCGG